MTTELEDGGTVDGHLRDGQRTPGSPRRGLDVVAHYDDVRRLICNHPSFRAATAEGMDADDLLQELLTRLIARQEQPSRWDISRGSISKYVWVFTTTTTSNLVRDHRRRQVERPTEGRAELEQGGSSSEHDSLPELEQLHRACAELDLGAEEVELVELVWAKQLRRDDSRVVRLGELVRERLRGDRWVR